jgi:hypothetical protein
MDSRDEKLEEPASCPIATQDIKANLANRQNAVDDANYGPANPNEPNDAYWKAKANEFQGDLVTAKKMLCGNCAAFNQTSKVLGCIKKGIGEDANEVAIGGNLGYCEIFDFKCAAKRTCDAWIVGGPLTDDKKKVETEFSRDCGQVEDGTFGPDNKCAEGYGRPALKGGYEPKRPIGEPRKDSAKETPKTKEQVLPQTKIPKYKQNEGQRTGKLRTPPKGVKLFNGANDERDWNQYRSEITRNDQNAIWKVGEIGVKGKNLEFNDWRDQVRNDQNAWQITDDFRGRHYIKMNEKPESDVGKKLRNLMEQQKPIKQKSPLYRGMGFATEKEGDDYVRQLTGGAKLNRTLTSFSEDKDVARSFGGGSEAQVKLRLVKSSKVRQFHGLDSSGEKEFVLPYGARIRAVGEPKKREAKNLRGEKFGFIYEVDVEEY